MATPSWLDWGTKKTPTGGERPSMGSGIAEIGAETITSARLRQKKAMCEQVEEGYWDEENNVCLSSPPRPPVD